MNIYAENILDHYWHPRNKRHHLPAVEGMNGGRVTHEEINESCGDSLAIRLAISAGRISAIQWDGSGCAISQAAISMLSEELAGKSIADAESLKKEDIYSLLGVPIGPRRVKCALLGLHALKNAIKKFKGEPPAGWNDTAGSSV